jgi:hypothetical protein
MTSEAALAVLFGWFLACAIAVAATVFVIAVEAARALWRQVRR